MVEIGTYRTRRTRFAQAALAAAGIPSVVAADDAGGAYPFDLRAAPVCSSTRWTRKTPRRSCPTLDVHGKERR